MRLDRHRPYGQVWGLPGVAFAQDGQYFDGSGRPVAEPEGDSQAPEMAEEIGRKPRTEADSRGDFPKVEITSSVPLPKSDDMRLAANKALKLQMENFGEEWQGVEHARKFLGVTE
jgi:hypothetical protein